MKTTRRTGLLAAALLGAAGFAGGADSDQDVFAGRLVDEYGHPLARWHVAATPVPSWWPAPVPAFTDAHGRFRLDASRRVLHRLSVGSNGTWTGPPITEPLRAGRTDLELIVRPAQIPHARVRCRLAAPDGTPLVGARARLHAVGECGSADFDFDPKTGEGISWRVATGTYEVRVDDPRCGTHAFGTVTVAGAADVELGTLRFPVPGAVRIEASADADASVSGIRYRIVRLSTWAPQDRSDVSHGVASSWRARSREFEGFGTLRAGEVVTGALNPGRYVLWADASGVQRVERAFDVRSGETARVAVPLRAAAPRRIHLLFPGVRPGLARVVVREASGEITVHEVCAMAGFVFAYLRPGAYRVEAEGDDLRRFTGDLVIAEGEPAPLEIRMALATDAPVKTR